MKTRLLVEAATEPLLVIVHPGSLCGSYLTSGVYDEKQLERLLHEIETFRGDIAIVHGDLSDELPDYRRIDDVILNAANREGAVEYEAEATGAELTAVAAEIAKDFNVAVRPQVVVTGAWADKADGCVTTVAKELENSGANVTISAHSPKWE